MLISSYLSVFLVGDVGVFCDQFVDHCRASRIFGFIQMLSNSSSVH
jgi:hypothetical protein